MQFLDLGNGGNEQVDNGVELELTFPPGMKVTLPLMIDAAFQGGAPSRAIMQLWERVWPETFPGPLVCAMVLAELQLRLMAVRQQQAVEEATRPN